MKRYVRNQRYTRESLMNSLPAITGTTAKNLIKWGIIYDLHLDREAFTELVTAASHELHIPSGIIEKDYYVTLALRELSARINGMVFKGGTSLTKCYQF